MESIESLQRRHHNEHAQGRPPLRRHGFIKTTPLEGRAAPPPWWWYLSCCLCFCVVSDSWLVSRTHRTYILEVSQSEPPRLAPYHYHHANACLIAPLSPQQLVVASSPLLPWYSGWPKKNYYIFGEKQLERKICVTSRQGICDERNILTCELASVKFCLVIMKRLCLRSNFSDKCDTEATLDPRCV